MGTEINLYQHQNDLLINSFDDIILKLMQKRVNNDKLKSLLFCGSEPGVGTTTITINMAISLAQSKNRTLLVDSDMRKTAKSKRLSETPPLGLSDYLLAKASVRDIINLTNIENLDYIASGTAHTQSARLFRLNTLDDLISALYNNYDFILFDSPSLGVVNDASLLSILVDGIFLVGELGITTKSSIKKMTVHFSQASDKLLGILVNKVDRSEYRMYMKNYDYFQKRRTLKDE